MRDLLKNFRFMIRDFPIKIELVLPAFPARSSGRRKIISPLPLGDEAFPKKSG
jgi:pyoverdine/dityrosine biosynthesis protein Dit1